MPHRKRYISASLELLALKMTEAARAALNRKCVCCQREFVPWHHQTIICPECSRADQPAPRKHNPRLELIDLGLEQAEPEET